VAARAISRLAVLGVLLVAIVPTPLAASAKTPEAGGWSKAPDLPSQRIGHAATLLPDGRVLVTGGANIEGTAMATAELFDPRANRWFGAGIMSVPRAAHTATLLSDGNVLVAGGQTGLSTFPIADLSSAEVYHPASNTWTSSASMRVARSRHNAVRLHDGRVLLVGGFVEPPAGAPPPTPVLEQAEVYNPDRNTWTLVGDGLPFVSEQAMTLLPSGDVLVTGGATNGVAATSQAELFDPATNRWRSTTWPMAKPRYGHTATLLPDGKVFLTGGYTTSTESVGGISYPNRDFLKSSEVFDLRGNTWVGVAPTNIPRIQHTATLLDDGMVLVVGSAYASNADSQLFDPANTENWTSTGMPMDRYLHTATRLVDGRVLIAGGFGVGSANTAWIFSPEFVASSASSNPVSILPIAGILLLLVVVAVILIATSGRWPRRSKRRSRGDTEWIDA
jgi:Galactose oxidase, central domain/Kelch motif